MSDEQTHHSVVIETYTDVWRGKMRLYGLEDIKLPAPIPVVSLGVFALTALLWGPLMYALGVPLSNGIGIIIYASLPAGLAVIANKEIFEGKSLVQYLTSQFRFLFQSKQYDDARPVPYDGDEGEIADVEIGVWVSMSEHYPADRKPPKRQRRNRKRKSLSA